MRLTTRLRRAAEEAPPAPDGPPPPPGPPPGSPVAAYVGILDGQTLWLAVDAAPGTLALRDDDGQVHPLTSDLPEDDPTYRSVRADLREILESTPGDAGGYDVVLVPGSGREPRQVWVAPFPRRPTRVPPSRDGRWQLAMIRTAEGMLRVRRRRPAPGIEVLDLAEDPTSVRVAFAATDADRLDLVEEETVLASYPLTREGDRSVAVLTEAGLPEGTGQLVRLQVGDLPLRRRANDLVAPNSAVLLPVLTSEETGHARLRLRWGQDVALFARIVDEDEDEA